MKIRFPLLLALAVYSFSTSCNTVSRKPSDKKILEIDSNAIEGWEVIPNRDMKFHKYSVVKENDLWQVVLPNGDKGLADKEYLRRSLHHLAAMRAMEAIRTPEEGWDSMGVTDKGTHLKVSSGGKTALDLIVGKMIFMNNKSTYYVRPAGQNTVYTVPLYLEGSLIAEPSRVRQKDLVPFSIAYIVDIKFLAPDGIQNTLRRDSATGKWMINDKPAEETRVAGYLQAVHGLVINRFSDAPITGAVHSLMITAADGKMVQIRANKKNSDTWVLSSPENPGNFAEIDEPAIAALFPGEAYFLKTK